MSSDKGAIINLKDVEFSYSGQPFISGLSIDVGQAEVIGLLGPNGSGKSTILKLMGGLLKPSSGNVTLWGKPIDSLRHKDRAKLISYLPQMLDVSVPFSVKELAGMGLYPYDSNPPMGVEEALGLVGLEDKAGTPITHLSGGERRRAFIAMTLIQGAGVLLLDEPLANLDIRYLIETLRLLRGLSESRKIAIVMALHDVNIAFQFERIILIKEGRVLGDGPPGETLNESLLKRAFETDVRVSSHGGENYVSYGF